MVKRDLCIQPPAASGGCGDVGVLCVVLTGSGRANRLKAMIKEVDEDNDGQLSFREFLNIYRKAGKLGCAVRGSSGAE